MWLSSSNNIVYKFDETDYQYYDPGNSPLPGKAQQLFIEFDQSNNLWIASRDSGLYIRHIDSSWSFYPPGEENILRGNEILILYKDDLGVMYIGTDIGLTIFDNGTWKYIELFEDVGYYSDIYNIYKSTFDSIYVLTSKYCYVEKGAFQKKFNPTDFGLSGSQFNGIAENNGRDLFFSSFDGFLMFPKLGGAIVYDKETTPGGEKIVSLGNVFFDKYRSKLFFNNSLEMITFENEEFSTSFCVGCDDIASPRLGAVFYDQDNRFWIGNSNYLYAKKEGVWKTYRNIHPGPGAPKFSQTTVGELIFGLSDHIYILRDSLWLKTNVEIGLTNNGLYDLASGKDNKQYVATRKGIYGKPSFEYYWTNIGVTELTNSITCDINGLIWFSMKNQIGSYDGETITYYNESNSDLPPSKDYDGIRADSLGRLWLKTDTSIYLNEQGEWKCVIPGSLLYNELINVYVDDYHNTWVLTDYNLYFMNQNDTIIYNYDNAPFADKYFRGGTPGPDNSFYINSNSGITTVQYTILEDIEDHASAEPESDAWLKVFPNPAEGFVTFEVLGEGLSGKTEQSTVEIKNLLGQSMAGFSFEGKSMRWDTKSLNPGIYIYQIRQDNRKSSGKLVVR